MSLVGPGGQHLIGPGGQQLIGPGGQHLIGPGGQQQGGFNSPHGALMAPNYVYTTDDQYRRRLNFTEHFNRDAQQAAAKDPVVALDSITRGTLTGLTPILSADETYLPNEKLYIDAVKYGFIGVRPGQPVASGLPNTSSWGLPTRQQDLERLARLQDAMRSHEKFHLKRQPAEAPFPAGPPGTAAAPGAAHHHLIGANLAADGTYVGTAPDPSCNLPTPFGGGSCASLEPFACLPCDPVFRDMIGHNNLSKNPKPYAEVLAECQKLRTQCQPCFTAQGYAPVTSCPTPNIGGNPNTWGPNTWGPGNNTPNSQNIGGNPNTWAPGYIPPGSDTNQFIPPYLQPGQGSIGPGEYPCSASGVNFSQPYALSDPYASTSWANDPSALAATRRA